MKKATITLLFLAISLIAFAQSAFTEKVFNDQMVRYGKDPMQFLKTEADPSFMLVGTSGYVFDYKGITALIESMTTETSVFSDVKVRQFGTTGIATGLWEHSHKSKKDGSVTAYKELFTYVFSDQKGKWMLVSAQHSEATKVSADEVAIKNVIQTETKNFHENTDRNGLLSYWKIDENTRMVYSTPSQEAIFLKGSDLKTAVENGTVPKADNAAFEMTNFVIRSGANAAWASFDQKVTQKSGSAGFSHEMRGLEKVNGAWKIVSSSVHAYSPNAASDKANDEKQIQATTDAFIKSWNNHDFSDMKNYLTEDCDWANPVGMLWKNRKEVMYAHDAYHKTFLKNTTMTKEKTTIRFTTADAAVVHIVVHLTEYTRPNNQKMPAVDFLGLMVFTKKGDKWLISSAQTTNIDAAIQEMNPAKTMPKE